MSTPSEPIIYKRPLTLSNSVELYWYPPTDDGANIITSYIVECANISYINVLPSTDRKSIVRNLITGNSYTFTVKATNINGNGNISSFNFTIPGFKPDYPLNTNFKTHITDYSNIFFSFNDPLYIGNSEITYNTFTLNPLDVSGNIMAKSPFILTHSAIGSNIIDPLYLERLNTNYDYKTYLQSENRVNCSDRNYFSTPINPNLPTNGLKLWLDPYDLTSLTLSNSKIVKWEDKSKNQSNATVNSVGFSPDSISGLKLWIDSQDISTITLTTGNIITSLRDKSTNSYLFSNASGFTYNNTKFNTSYPSFYNNNFNSSNNLGANSTIATNQPFTVFYIGSQPGGYFHDSVDGSNRIAVWAGGDFFAGAIPGWTSGASGNYIISGYFNTINSSAFLNGSSTPYGTGNAGSNNMLTLLLGNRNSLNESYTGHLCEILMFNGVLSTQDRQKIEGYLAWKWGIQSSLAINHPWKNINPLSILNFIDSQGPTYDSGNALINFNGSQYLSLPNNTIPSGNTAYSIFTYVSTSNIAKNGQWFLYSGTPTANLSLGGFINSNTIVHSWYTNQQTSNSIIKTNISYFVELTVDSGIRKTFINGTLVTQDNVITRSSTTANNIIGTNSDLTGNLVGSIGDIIVYDRILTSLERSSVRNYLERKKYNISLNNVGNVVTWLDATDQNNLFDSAIYKKVSYNNYVANWLDRSYANNNASQSNVSVLPIRRPYMQNNLDVLEFNESYLNIPTSSYPLDAFIILKLANIDGNVSVLGVSPNSNNYSSLSYDRPQGNVWYIGSTSNIISAPVQETSANFLLLEWSISNNNNYIRRYGANLTFDTARTWTLPNNSNIIIGNANGFDFSSRFKGYIGEILMFNRQLEDGYRYSIEGYLSWKWGLQNELASDHPYKNNPPYLFYKYIPTTQGSSFTPTSITGLSLWLDASSQSYFSLNGININSWYDRSTNNLVATKYGSSNITLLSNQVNINNSSYFEIPNIPALQLQNESFCIFAVYKTNNNGSSQILLSKFQEGGSYNGWALNATGANIGSDFLRPQWFNGVANYKLTNTIAVDSTSKMLSLYQTPNLLNGILNGNVETSLSIPKPTLHSGSLLIGIRQTNYQVESFNGSIQEILIYSNFITLDERQKTEGYLAWKWGLQANLPSNHPYKNAAP